MRGSWMRINALVNRVDSHLHINPGRCHAGVTPSTKNFPGLLFQPFMDLLSNRICYYPCFMKMEQLIGLPSQIQCISKNKSINSQKRDTILCAVISVAMLRLQFIVGFPIFKKTIRLTGDYSLLC